MDMSSEEIIKKATEKLQKNGIPNHLHAKYINLSAHIALDLKKANPLLRLLAPRIKAPENVAWGCSYVLVHNLLKKWNMMETLDCIKKETEGVQIPEVEDFIDPGEEENYLMNECIRVHEFIPFKTRYFDFRSELLAHFNEEEDIENAQGANEEESIREFETSTDREQSGLLPRTNELNFSDSD